MNHRTLNRLLWAPVLVVLAALLLFFLFRSWNVLLFPHEVEYGEGPVLAWARQLTVGRLPYKQIESFPWNFSVYAPGYLLASGSLLALLPALPWFGGRLLSLGSGLLLAALIPRLLPRREGPARWAGWLAAALWLATPYLFRWATFYRPDLFALLWSGIGLLLVQRALDGERPALLAGAALCFVASFWSKQSFFAAPLAATLYLLATRRAWLPYLLLPGIAGGGAILAALWLATGGALFDNLVAANANPFSWATFWMYERSFFQSVPLLALLAAREGWQSWRGRKAGLFPLYTLLALLVTLSVGKAGAWENYFLEPLWLFCLLAGRTLADWMESPGRRSHVVPVLLLLQLALFLPGFERRSPVAEQAWLAEMSQVNGALHETVRAFPPDALILSEQMGVLAEEARPVPLHSFVYTQLEYQGLWDPAPLLAQLAGGKAPLLIQRFDVVADPFKHERWSRAMVAASERGYALGAEAGWWLQRPPLPFLRPDTPRPVGGNVELLNWMIVREPGTCDDPARESLCPGEVASPPVELPGGERLGVHLLWHSRGQEPLPLSVSVQLFAPDGSRVAQHDDLLRRGLLGGPWPAGAIVRDEHLLELPAGLPAGPYSLLVTLYESETLAQRGSVTLQQLKVSPPPPGEPLAVSREVPFGERLRLLSHDRLPQEAAAGGEILLRAQWRAERTEEAPLTAFLHLIAPDGSLVAQSDFPPPYPPPFWSPGERVEVDYTLHLPAELPSGDYELRLGWYDSTSLERLPAEDGEAIDGALRLGSLTVR